MSTKKRGRGFIAGTAVCSALLVIAATGAALLMQSPASRIADAEAPPPSVITAQVQYKALEASVVVRGTVTQGASVQVLGDIAPADGGTAPVITRVLVKPGQIVRAGSALMEISGRPIFVLRGAIPAYRDLRPGATGNDVGQLQSALRSLGYAVTDTRGFYGPSTKQAVAAFYSQNGFEALPASSEDRESIRAAEDAVIQARRARDEAVRTSAKETEGSDPGSSHSELRYAQEDLDRAEADLVEVQARTGPMIPAGEIVYVRARAARVSALPARVGQRVDGPVATLATGRVIVRTLVKPAQEGLIRRGMPISLLADAQGLTATGETTAVAEKANSEGLYAVEARLDSPYSPSLVGQEVRITFKGASTDDPKLIVPLSAVSARTDGSTAVSVLTKDAQEEVAVETGVSSDGYIAVRPISADALREGDKVVVGRR